MCVQFFRCCCSSSEVNWEKKAVRPTNQIGWKMVKKVYELKIKIWNKRHHRVIWWENLAPADLRSSHFFLGKILSKFEQQQPISHFFLIIFKQEIYFFQKIWISQILFNIVFVSHLLKIQKILEQTWNSLEDILFKNFQEWIYLLKDPFCLDSLNQIRNFVLKKF